MYVVVYVLVFRSCCLFLVVQMPNYAVRIRHAVVLQLSHPVAADSPCLQYSYVQCLRGRKTSRYVFLAIVAVKSMRFVYDSPNNA